MTADPSPPTERVRRTTFFSGRVQGVGFRFTTERVAAGFAVTGFVRNLADGRVELVAEGDATELDRFHAAVHRSLERYIQDAQASDSHASGEFSGFRIAF